jgi:hypothetical protein
MQLRAQPLTLAGRGREPFTFCTHPRDDFVHCTLRIAPESREIRGPPGSLSCRREMAVRGRHFGFPHPLDNLSEALRSFVGQPAFLQLVQFRQRGRRLASCQTSSRFVERMISVFVSQPIDCFSLSAEAICGCQVLPTGERVTVHKSVGGALDDLSCNVARELFRRKKLTQRFVGQHGAGFVVAPALACHAGFAKS